MWSCRPLYCYREIRYQTNEKKVHSKRVLCGGPSPHLQVASSKIIIHDSYAATRHAKSGRKPLRKFFRPHVAPG